MFLAKALAALSPLFFITARAANGFQCQQTTSLPYCVYVQSDNAPDGGSWPVSVFLPGSGARGDLSQANYLAGYDGHGKMISQYLSGQRDGPQKIAAEQFLTVIPIASMSENARNFYPEQIMPIIQEVISKFNVDKNRIYLSGYSLGSRSTFRNLVAHPEIFAAAAPSAGAAEDIGADTLQQQAAPPVFPSLNKVLDIPIWQFAGKSDETAGYTGAEATQAEIVRLGGGLSKLTEFDGATHSDMSTKPWTDTDLLSWLLQYKRSSKSSTTGATKPKSSVPPTKTRSGKGSKPSTAVAVRPTPTLIGDEQDCDDTEDEQDDDDCDDVQEHDAMLRRRIEVASKISTDFRQDQNNLFAQSRRALSAPQHRAQFSNRLYLRAMQKHLKMKRVLRR